MGQVHEGEEGHALRFHPARSRSLRLVSSCTRRLAFARSRRSLLVEEGVDGKDDKRECEGEREEGKKGATRRKGMQSDFRSFSHVPLGQGVGC